jgi:ABC-type transporter Mla subunit MlaD
MFVLGVAVIVLALCATYVSTISVNSSAFAPLRTVRAELPARGAIVKPGDEVRIAGKRVGQVSSVSIGRGVPVATLQVHTGAVRRDAQVRVRLRGLAGAVTVELEPGRAGPALPNGGLIPRTQSTSGTQVADVIGGFDAATRAALARTLARAGAGSAGRGEAINQAIAAAAPTLEHAPPLLRALRPQPGAAADLVVQADRALEPLSPRGSSDLGTAVTSADAVTGPVAAHARSLGTLLDAAPGLEQQVDMTLPSADGLLGHLQHTAAVIRPGIRALRASLPSLRGTETASRNLPALDRVAVEAQPVIAAAAPVVRRLWTSASAVGAAVPPVVTLARYLIPYGHELVEAPAGFTRWGEYTYDNGQGAGHKAVRFTMVFTCAKARDPYPAPGAAAKERTRCQG